MFLQILAQSHSLKNIHSCHPDAVETLKTSDPVPRHKLNPEKHSHSFSLLRGSLESRYTCSPVVRTGECEHCINGARDGLVKAPVRSGDSIGSRNRKISWALTEPLITATPPDLKVWVAWECVRNAGAVPPPSHPDLLNQNLPSARSQRESHPRTG